MNEVPCAFVCTLKIQVLIFSYHHSHLSQIIFFSLCYFSKGRKHGIANNFSYSCSYFPYIHFCFTRTRSRGCITTFSQVRVLLITTVQSYFINLFLKSYICFFLSVSIIWGIVLFKRYFKLHLVFLISDYHFVGPILYIIILCTLLVNYDIDQQCK